MKSFIILNFQNIKWFSVFEKWMKRIANVETINFRKCRSINWAWKLTASFPAYDVRSLKGWKDLTITYITEQHANGNQNVKQFQLRVLLKNFSQFAWSERSSHKLSKKLTNRFLRVQVLDKNCPIFGSQSLWLILVG